MKKIVASSAVVAALLVSGSAPAAWTITTIASKAGNLGHPVGPHGSIARSAYHNQETIHVAYQKHSQQYLTDEAMYTSKGGVAAWTAPKQVWSMSASRYLATSPISGRRV